MPQRALSCTRASLYRTGGPEHGPGNARGGMPITEVRNPDRYPVPAHSPAERGFAPLRFRPARFGKAGPYASDNTPRNDPGTAVAKHAATGQPVPDTMRPDKLHTSQRAFDRRRKLVAIPFGRRLLSLSDTRSLGAFRRKPAEARNGLLMDTDSPDI